MFLFLVTDFHKIGGYRVLDGVLRSNYGDIRWRAAELIAALVQNNPYCQQKALEVNILPLLVEMVDSDVDMLVRVKALYAISCKCASLFSRCCWVQRTVSYDPPWSWLSRCLQLSLPRIEFVLANHRTRNAHVISGNAQP